VEIVEKLNKEINAAWADTKITARLAALGAIPPARQRIVPETQRGRHSRPPAAIGISAGSDHCQDRKPAPLDARAASALRSANCAGIARAGPAALALTTIAAAEANQIACHSACRLHNDLSGLRLSQLGHFFGQQISQTGISRKA
jgi:hypothetical protein